jgi:hypothetical protein
MAQRFEPTPSAANWSAAARLRLPIRAAAARNLVNQQPNKSFILRIKTTRHELRPLR